MCGVTGWPEAEGAKGKLKAAEAQVLATVVETEVGRGGGPGLGVCWTSLARAVCLSWGGQEEGSSGFKLWLCSLWLSLPFPHPQYLHYPKDGSRQGPPHSLGPGWVHWWPHDPVTAEETRGKIV